MAKPIGMVLSLPSPPPLQTNNIGVRCRQNLQLSLSLAAWYPSDTVSVLTNFSRSQVDQSIELKVAVAARFATWEPQVGSGWSSCLPRQYIHIYSGKKRRYGAWNWRINCTTKMCTTRPLFASSIEFPLIVLRHLLQMDAATTTAVVNSVVAQRNSLQSLPIGHQVVLFFSFVDFVISGDIENIPLQHK